MKRIIGALVISVLTVMGVGCSSVREQQKSPLAPATISVVAISNYDGLLVVSNGTGFLLEVQVNNKPAYKVGIDKQVTELVPRHNTNSTIPSSVTLKITAFKFTMGGNVVKGPNGRVTFLDGGNYNLKVGTLKKKVNPEQTVIIVASDF
jgi:hypothetical protein